MAPVTATRAIKERFVELDLIRYLAALWVSLFHLTNLTPHPENNFFFNTLAIGFDFGYLGVDCFFIISGFVITMSVDGRGPIEFLISRISRLYPAYWACATITTIVIASTGNANTLLQGGLRRYLYNLTMFETYFQIAPVDGVYWTLLLEWQFYFCVTGVLMLQMMRFKLPFLWLWMLLDHLKQYQRGYAGTFCVGVVCYDIYKEGLSLVRFLTLIVSSAIACHQTYVTVALRPLWFQPYQHIATGVTLSFCVLFFCVSQRWTKYERFKSQFRFLGNLTYPYYLLHAVNGSIFLQATQAAPAWIMILVAICIVTLGSWLVFRFVEEPIMHRWRKWMESVFVRKLTPEQQARLLLFPLHFLYDKIKLLVAMRLQSARQYQSLRDEGQEMEMDEVDETQATASKP